MAQGRLRRLVTRGRVRRAVVCLILGGVMTVAVAWGCALFLAMPLNLTVGGGPYYEQYRPDDWPHLDRMYMGESVGFTARHAHRVIIAGDVPVSFLEVYRKGGVVYWIIEHRYGLLWRSMVSFRGGGDAGGGQFITDPNSPASHRPDFPPLASGFEIPSWFPKRFHGRTLPLRPMWPGFLYSTLVYGAFAWPVLCAPGFLRKRCRLRRRRRGLCVWCKYPVRAFAVCPECGKPTEREA